MSGDSEDEDCRSFGATTMVRRRCAG
jgi:hypothetical protein